MSFICLFFFQAEDGIRDHCVTGVQTCALPIYFKPVKLNLKASLDLNSEVKRVEAPNVAAILPGRDPKLRNEYVVYSAHWDRSEERRVGKECRRRCGRQHEKKNRRSGSVRSVAG